METMHDRYTGSKTHRRKNTAKKLYLCNLIIFNSKLDTIHNTRILKPEKWETTTGNSDWKQTSDMMKLTV